MGQIKSFQKAAYANKVVHGFNTTDVYKEFGLLYGELAEAFDAYQFGRKNLGEELADITIYLLGLSAILGVDLESETAKKMKINATRKYKVSGKGHKKIKK